MIAGSPVPYSRLHPTADVVVHSAALSLSLSLSLSLALSFCTERSSPFGSWRCEESDIYAREYLRKKTNKCTCFAGIVAISAVAAYIHQFFCAFCVANPSFSSHVRGSAVRRGENERIRSGQRCQSDVLQLRAAGHQLVLRSVAGEKTSKTWTDRQSEESGHRGRPNRRGAERHDRQIITGRVNPRDALKTFQFFYHRFEALVGCACEEDCKEMERLWHDTRTTRRLKLKRENAN